MLKAFFIWAMFSASLVQALGPGGYAEGQVWEYRTRPGEEGSLLKIQRIEQHPAFSAQGGIYHISIVGLRLSGATQIRALPHAPVSRQTLDASVTRLATRSPDFPDAEEGIAHWRAAQGGVFTITVAEIAEMLDQSLSAGAQEQ